jgi:hypothetical protein
VKKLVMIVALLASASISAMADDTVNTVNGVAVSSSNPNVATRTEAQAQLRVAELPQTPTPMSWSLIASANGPSIPAGWQIVGIEGVLSNGNSINRWQYYLYNPTTRATRGWLIQVN